ncbi:uncharacterized protein LOC123274383 [Cotesia glomerata]|nr:uncharacterized protein LOC123274383 [Cotesia glomerata]
MLYYLIAFCAIAVLGASAQKQTSYGVTQNEAPDSLSCPKVRPFYVNLNRMTGRWFLQLISSNTGLQHDTETCKRDFWNQPNGNKAQVILSAYSPVLGGYSEVVTDLSFNANTYNMTIVVPIIENINVKHSILDTDYYSYAIYYACITDGSNS